MTGALSRFRDEPGTLFGCFGGALFVQASTVLFYFAVAYALHLDLTLADLSVIVPISFVVQMSPVSVSGFGVREATFSFYFSSIGHPIESAILMSLVAQALISAVLPDGRCRVRCARTCFDRHLRRIVTSLHP